MFFLSHCVLPSVTLYNTCITPERLRGETPNQGHPCTNYSTQILKFNSYRHVGKRDSSSGDCPSDGCGDCGDSWCLDVEPRYFCDVRPMSSIR